MNNCGNKIKQTCAEKNYATCVYYELEVPSISNLVEENCVTIEDTTKDIYDLIVSIKEDINLSDLGDIRIDYSMTPKIVKNIILLYEQEICDLKDKVHILETTAICNINITDCGLTNLPVDPCNSGNTVSTLAELLQHLINQTTP